MNRNMKKAMTAILASLWTGIMNDKHAASMERIIPGYVMSSRKRRPRLSIK